MDVGEQAGSPLQGGSSCCEPFIAHSKKELFESPRGHLLSSLVNKGNEAALSIGRRLSSWLCTKRPSAELHIEVSLLKTTISGHDPNFGAKPLLLNLDVFAL